MTGKLNQSVKAMIGPRLTVALRCLLQGKPIPRWGNFRRTSPFSTIYGSDRGTPLDRFYLHRFLEKNRKLITGDVLEIQISTYTGRYGNGVARADTIDIEAKSKPTFLCDLAESEPLIQSSSYNCFLMPNTLQNLRNIEGCLTQALRVLKPGGVILASTACFVPLTPDVPDYWRLTTSGWKEITAKTWPGCEVEIESHGNCLAATAAMMGIAMEELSEEELTHHDPRFPVLTTILCRKPV